MFAFFEGLSNVYILSTATVFLAVIIALYCANFIKEENGKRSAPFAQMAIDEIDDDDSGAGSDSDTEISDGIVRHLKSARIKELESTLTEDQLEEEKRVEREQLAAIFELLKRQEAELNMKEIDESELSAQMRLYR